MPISELFDPIDDDDSPICAACGVSALPPEEPGDSSRCENADCVQYGEPIG